MDLGIRGKVALVVAGSRGLGRATAEALAAEGVRVMLSARDPDGLADAQASMRSTGPTWRPGLPTSPTVRLRPPWSRQRWTTFGTLDILVANAGGPPPGRALDLDDALLEAALNANLMSAVRLTRAAVPVMRGEGWGRICCISSYSVVQPIPGLALSNTARTGLWAWVKTAAQDLAAEGSGITLNLVCPGPHATDRMRELGGTGVMGDPADFGSVVSFLCSRQAGFINGAALVVDGGSTLAL